VLTDRRVRTPVLTMPQVTCRCGEVIDIQPSSPDRIDCPRCAARIRLRRRRRSSGLLQGASETADGFVRFFCPCGRRLKVRASGRPEAGKCPDCGRVVPVPNSALSDSARMSSPVGESESRTDEMDNADLARIQEWTANHLARSGGPEFDAEATPASVPAFGDGSQPSNVKFEAGLRVCPACGKPVHMSATTCRECGSPVPRR
jgi:hypothetical protein